MTSGLTRVACAAVAFLAVSAAGWQVPGRGAAQESAEAPLTNASVVKLVRAGFREKTVIAIIRTRPTRFDLSPDRLIELKKGGVSERVILAMLSRVEADAVEGGDWGDGDDEAFFGGGLGGRNPKQGSDPGETNIFGSSGGARGRTRSSGGGGGAEGETQTTGSATVRILRPPAEAGGAAPAKLERTPTLTNEAVVELVEAGFTEGTIIRRIEQSPAEFELTETKLAELRRRRVTEPVIAAMRAAMGGEGEQQQQQQARPEK